MNKKMIVTGAIILLAAIWGTAFGMSTFPDPSAYGVATLITGVLFAIFGLGLIVHGIDPTIRP